MILYRKFIIGGISMKRKVITAVICSILVVLITISVGIGYNIYKSEYKLTDSGVEHSPDGKYSVTFQMVGYPQWPFGSTKARVTVSETDSEKEITVINDEISDDGANLRSENWFVEWLDDTVKITLKGSEQYDKLYTIPLG